MSVLSASCVWWCAFCVLSCYVLRDLAIKNRAALAGLRKKRTKKLEVGELAVLIAKSTAFLKTEKGKLLTSLRGR